MARYVTPYLQRRGDVFYFRMAIPQALHLAFKRNEVTYSLRTKSKQVAAMRCRQFSTTCELFFDKVATMTDTLTPAELNTLLRQHFDALLKEKTVGIRFEHPEDLEEAKWIARADLSDLKDNLSHPEHKTEHEDALRLLRSVNKAGVSANSKVYQEILDGMKQAQYEVQRIYLAKLEGRTGSATMPAGMFAPQNDIATPNAPIYHKRPNNLVPEDDIPTLNTFIQDYCDRREADGRWREGTRQNHESDLRLFAETVGGERKLHIIKTDEILNYEQLLRKKPKYFERGHKFKGMSLAEAAAKSKPDERITPQVASKHYDNIVQLFEDAVIRRLLKENPAPKGIRNKVKAIKAERAPFTMPQLNLFLTSPALQNPKRFKRHALFWMPILLLYTGCRSAEISMLRVEDIKQDKDTGIHYFNITRHEKRNLKSPSSVRVIPMHPFLIEAGFLDYVLAIKKRKSKMLFPDSQKAKNPADAISKSLRYQRDKLGLKSQNAEKPMLDVHSFRGNFIDALRAQDVSEEIRGALTGHTAEGSDKFYGEGYPIKVLYEHLSKIEYPLDWDKILQKDT